MLSLDQLQRICITSQGRGRCGIFWPHLIRFTLQYGIDTPVRLAAFIAQVMHESGEFRYVRELGSNAYLAKYDTGDLAERLGNTPAADGDGQKYRGRGLIQITGAVNYSLCARALNLPLFTQPELLEQPVHAVESACWFWHSNHLNEVADIGNFRRITRVINGGYNGQDEREMYWKRAKSALGVAA